MDPRVYLIRILRLQKHQSKKINTFVSCRMEYNLTYHIYIYSSSPLFLWPIYSFLRSFLEIIVMSRTQSYAHDNDVQTYKKKFEARTSFPVCCIQPIQCETQLCIKNFDLNLVPVAILCRISLFDILFPIFNV